MILHSCIDGLVIGVFQEANEILVLAIGVIIHKIPAACAVGTTFQSNNQKLSHIGVILIFVFFILAAPTGMIIGIIIGETSDKNSLGLLVIQALSGGTFVYLACCDLLIHEFH